MPHKHKRIKIGGSHEDFNLPPTAIAKPLATGKQGLTVFTNTKSQGDKSRKFGREDDTPRAFRHLMRLQQTGKGAKGLDNGERVPKGKKRKRENGQSEAGKSDVKKAATEAGAAAAPATTKTSAKTKTTKAQAASTPTPTPQLAPPPSATAPAPQTSTLPPPTTAPALTIQPGERLGDFSARVNQALPLTGLSRKSKALTIDGKELREGKRTKHEKKLRRLQAGWREEEARIRDKEEEEKEEEREREEEVREKFGEEVVRFSKGVVGKRRRKGGGQDAGDGGFEDDPWAVLRKKRSEPKGVFDVVQEPPKFGKAPREKFKMREGAGVMVENVPVAAGSLRKREELVETRMDVIARYREIMKAKRNA